MAPRRPHTKSRSGCSRCKRRRIKCDESHPSCGNCVRHAVVCDFAFPPGKQRAVSQVATAARALPANTPTRELVVSGNRPYPAPSLFLHSHVPGESSITDPTYPIVPSFSIVPGGSGSSSFGNVTDPLVFRHISGESPNSALPSPSPSTRLSSPSHATVASHFMPPSVGSGVPTTFNLLDLLLMHHWSVSTWSTADNRESIQQLWRFTVPALAVEHPFLMHAILASSAIHLHSKDNAASKRARYLLAASQHHYHAVRGLAASLAHLSHANCDAVVAASSLVAIYSFLTSHTDDGRVSGDSSPAQIAWVPLLRGVASILARASAWVTDGSLSQTLLQRAPPRAAPSAQDPEMERVFQGLYRLCTEHALPGADELADTDVSTAYFAAISELRNAFAAIAQCDASVSAIFAWPVSASERFVRLLGECRPRALVIFVHYCTLFTLVDGFWWARGSARFELERCQKFLGEEWIPWVAWPRQKILAGDLGVAVASETARTEDPV